MSVSDGSHLPCADELPRTEQLNTFHRMSVKIHAYVLKVKKNNMK